MSPMRNLGSGWRRESGVAGLMAMIFLLVVVGFSAVTLLSMSSSDLHDTTAQNDGVAALFLAESGIERASQLYSAGTACGNGLLPAAPVNLGRGSMQATGVAPTVLSATSCRLQIQGRVGATTRTIQSDLERGPILSDIVFLSANGSTQTGNVNTLIWNHAIAAGAGPNRILVVGVAIRRTGVQAVQIGPQTTYNGTQLMSAGSVTDTVNGLRIEWLYAKNPPTGGNPQIRVRIGPGLARAVGVSMAFSGIDQVAPIDAISLAPPSCTGNYPANPSCSVTTLTDKARVVDMLAARLTSTAAAGGGQTPAWNFAAGNGNNGVRGAGSYRTLSTSPAGVVSMGWTLTPSPPPGAPFTNGWLQSVLALRPNPLTHVMNWTEK